MIFAYSTQSRCLTASINIHRRVTRRGATLLCIRILAATCTLRITNAHIRRQMTNVCYTALRWLHAHYISTRTTPHAHTSTLNARYHVIGQCISNAYTYNEVGCGLVSTSRELNASTKSSKFVVINSIKMLARLARRTLCSMCVTRHTAAA
jgi:hypothetical protein